MFGFITVLNTERLKIFVLRDFYLFIFFTVAEYAGRKLLLVFQNLRTHPIKHKTVLSGS